MTTGLKGLIDSRREASPQTLEACEMCSNPIGGEHAHLIDLDANELRCICQACRILFDRPEAGGFSFRIVPTRLAEVDDLLLTDEQWAALKIPVDMAFIVRRSRSAEAVAVYPGALGAVETTLDASTWEALQSSSALISGMAPDVEAVLVNRLEKGHEQWIVPIDECYRLVAVIRSHWRGMGGGSEVWKHINAFFDEIRQRTSSSRREN